jgi:hypothetical protein
VPIKLILVGVYWAAIEIGDALVMRKVVHKKKPFGLENHVFTACSDKFYYFRIKNVIFPKKAYLCAR